MKPITEELHNKAQNRLGNFHLSDSINCLGLQERVENYLKKSGINTLKDLKEISYENLFNMYGIGSGSINILMPIKDILASPSVVSPIIEVEDNTQTENIKKDDEVRTRIFGLSIEILELPKRTENALIKAKIITLGDFLNFPEEKFYKLKHIGVKSIKIFLKLKKAILEKPDTLLPEVQTTMENIHELTSTDIDISCEKIFSILWSAAEDERGREIITRRYGLLTGESQTLEEIGQHFGVTRERIRQVQKKIVRRLRHPTRRIYLQKLAHLVISQNDYLISDEEADRLVPKVLGGTDFDGSALLDLISEIGLIQSYRKGDFKIYSVFFRNTTLERLSENIISIIKKTGWGLNVSSIISRIKDLVVDTDENIDHSKFILKYCRLDPRIEEKNDLNTYSDTYEKDNEALINFRYYLDSHRATKAWVELMVRILEHEGTPLHFTEISNRLDDMIINSAQKIDVRRVHSILIENSVFAHSGVRGTYGLTKWGFRKDSTVDLVTECLKKAGFSLHWKQIYNYVSKFKDTKPANIMAILNSNPEFERKGKGIFGFSDVKRL